MKFRIKTGFYICRNHIYEYLGFVKNKRRFVIYGHDEDGKWEVEISKSDKQTNWNQEILDWTNEATYLKDCQNLNEAMSILDDFIKIKKL